MKVISYSSKPRRVLDKFDMVIKIFPFLPFLLINRARYRLAFAPKNSEKHENIYSQIFHEV